MRLVRQILLYMALGLGANAAMAADTSTAPAYDKAALEALREDSMRKLIFLPEPRAVSDASFQLEDNGGTASLADYRGKYVLLNFWATWCAPCRKEMPQIAELQDEFGGEKFEVLTLATGRNNPAGIVKFFEDNGIANLPRHQDPDMSVARDMLGRGRRVTVLIDPQGREIARMLGDAEWNSDSAKAIISTMIGS